jgi:N-acetylmuramoyl-L-alanine amidase
LKKAGYTVHLTREDDTFIPLATKGCGSATTWKPTCSFPFMLIRYGAARNWRADRPFTPCPTRHRTSLPRILAAVENMSDIIAGVELEQTSLPRLLIFLSTLPVGRPATFSVYFARTLVNELKSAVRLINNPHRSAGFRVLKAHDVPSVLVELGYLSNDHDEKLLISEEWRERMAVAMVEAIDGVFFGRALPGKQPTSLQ